MMWDDRTVWLKIPFEQLKEGDVFRMFESSGEPVVGMDGGVIFEALENPSKLEGFDAIKVEEIEEEME